ncbi:MAG TPA: hypothetical protein V6D18_04545 [Thermosynechococcaceae cyanobacterium]|jgi:hypothetical protein
MNNGDGLIKELHDESIQRFLNELDYPARKALADAKISISFGEGDQETVELAERYTLVLSPISPVLHIQAEPNAYYWSLLLSLTKFLEAAGRAGLERFSICTTPLVGCVYYCKTK